MRFVVVTGMSGSGKATAIKMLEDEGYYCVDNLPVRLIDKFMELVFMPGNEITKVVLGLDVRADQPFAYVEEVLSRSDVDSGIRPSYGEQLLTLSTCEYSTDNGRYVVVARRVSS